MGRSHPDDLPVNEISHCIADSMDIGVEAFSFLIVIAFMAGAVAVAWQVVILGLWRREAQA